MDLTAIVDVLSEAGDPHTPSSRLEELAQHPEPLVRQMARRNASLTETAHQRYINEGDPDAWASPLVTFLLLLMVGNPEVQAGARRCAIELAKTPRADLEPDLRTAVVPVLESWWQESQDAGELLIYTGGLARAQDGDGPTHRTLVRIASVYVAMVADLSGEWKGDIDQAMELVNAWLNQKRINPEVEGERLFSRFNEAAEANNIPAAYALRTAQTAVQLTDRWFNSATVEAAADLASKSYEATMGEGSLNARQAFAAEVALAVRKAVPHPPLPPALGGLTEPPPPPYTPRAPAPSRTKRAPVKKRR